MIEHPWHECRPAVLPLGHKDRAETERLQAVADAIFDGLSDAERSMFHQFTCYNRHYPEHLAVIKKFRDLMEAADKQESS